MGMSSYRAHSFNCHFVHEKKNNDQRLCNSIYLLTFQMMQNLLLEEGGLVQVESVNLQVATYSKFQPQSPDFLDITNPKAVYPFTITTWTARTSKY